jgi:activator of 2-hydroxyglutaryl-CoA dehydratase
MGKAAQVPFRPTIVFSGGVALNVGVVKAIEDLLSAPVTVPEQPQITAALGAALLAHSGAAKKALGDQLGQAAGGAA